MGARGTREARNGSVGWVWGRQRVAGRAVKRIVDWFCEGSVEALLVGMVDSKVLDRAELQRLADRIAAAQLSAVDKKSQGKRREEKP